jgi:hypothetical protein
MEKTSVPIACTLTADQLRERREGLLRKVGSSLQQTLEREGGYAFRFPPELFDELSRIVGLERRCCPFLRFVLTSEPSDGPVWLEITGPAESKSFLATFWE